MNLIDKVLLDIASINAGELIDRLTHIFEAPIDRNELKNYPQFIQDIIFIIELDTELAMEGIGGLLENSIGEYIDRIIIALNNISANRDALLLQRIFTLYTLTPDDAGINELADKLYLYTDSDIDEKLHAYVEASLMLYRAKIQ